MTLDNDLLDLWLLAGLVGGLDEPTAKRLIEELQQLRVQAEAAAADTRTKIAKDMSLPLDRHDRAVKRLEELRDDLAARMSDFNEEITVALTEIGEAGDELHTIKEADV